MTKEERRQLVFEAAKRRFSIVDADVRSIGSANEQDDDIDRGIEGFECAHCGTPFELGTTHPLCRRCRAVVCYPECSLSACAGWGPGFEIVEPVDPDTEEP
jgi:hypothetical protein